MEKIEEQALQKFKDTENAYREWLHGIHRVGNGILDQIEEGQ